MKKTLLTFMTAASCLLASHTLQASPSLFGIEMVDGGDMNNDGFHDIVTVVSDTINSSTLRAINSQTGKEFWSEPIPVNYVDFTSTPIIAVPSLDLDKNPDFIFGVSFEDTVFFHSGADGSIFDQFSIQDPGAFGAALLQLSEDLDGDGVNDLIVGAPAYPGPSCKGSQNTDGSVYAISTQTKNVIWQTIAPSVNSNNFGLEVTLLRTDYDKDGMQDLLVSDPCNLNSTGTQGAVYIVSAQNGAILQTVENPTQQPNAANNKNILFGNQTVATRDLNNDGVADYFVGAPNIGGKPGLTSVDLISGSNGSLICHYNSPDVQLDGFGSQVVGGTFEFGAPTDTIYSIFDLPYDIVVSATDVNLGKGKVYVLRIDGRNCNAAPVEVIEGNIESAYFGNRVALLGAPIAPNNYIGILSNSTDSPLNQQGDFYGAILSFSGKDASLLKTYVTP